MDEPACRFRDVRPRSAGGDRPLGGRAGFLPPQLGPQIHPLAQGGLEPPYQSLSRYPAGGLLRDGAAAIDRRAVAAGPRPRADGAGRDRGRGAGESGALLSRAVVLADRSGEDDAVSARRRGSGQSEEPPSAPASPGAWAGGAQAGTPPDERVVPPVRDVRDLPAGGARAGAPLRGERELEPAAALLLRSALGSGRFPVRHAAGGLR